MAQMQNTPPQAGAKGVDRTTGEPVTFDGQDWIYDEPAPSSSEGAIMGGLTGALKGAGQTATNLGRAASAIPGVGSLTTGLGNAISGGVSRLRGQQPALPASRDASFAAADTALEPTSRAQAIGKGAEQIGEFLLPGPSTGRAITSVLARAIPDAASPAAMRVLNQIARLTGRATGDATNAAAISALHGDENVDAEAGIAGGTSLAAELLPMALGNPTLNKALSIIIAGRMPGASSGGLAGRMGTFGILRNMTQDALDAAGKTTSRTSPRRVGRGIGAAAAGVKSELEERTPRRRQ
jgi:hypothetical protein